MRAALRSLARAGRSRPLSTWVHMNAAGASPTSEATHAAVVAHLEAERAVGGYEAAARASGAARATDGRCARDAHAALAGLLGCDASEIALFESAQAAWAAAFYSLAFRPGDRVLCFESEYGGNAVAFLQVARRTGCTVEVLPMLASGVVDVAALERALAGGGAAGSRALVALTHINSDCSVVQPAARVGALARSHGATYLLDACQSIGMIDVDVRALGADFACGTGRKWLRGPRGTGFLYARGEALPERAGAPNGLVGEPPVVDHTSVEWLARGAYELRPGGARVRYEMWENAVALRAGLAVAADEARALGRLGDVPVRLAARLRAGLAAVPGVELRDAPAAFDDDAAAAEGASRAAIVCFVCAGSAAGGRAVESQRVVDELAARRIGVSASPPRHTFDDTQWARPASVRASPSHLNTEAEVDALVAAVREIVAA